MVVVEAFIYAPGYNQGNLIRRMEAALYTLRLPDELEEINFSYDIEEITIVSEQQ